MKSSAPGLSSVRMSKSDRNECLRICNASTIGAEILFRNCVHVSLLDENTRSDDTEDAWAGRMSSATLKIRGSLDDFA